MRAVVVVDGEHYPPVTMDTIRSLETSYDVAAAVFAGGGEKLSGPLELGTLPIVRAETVVRALQDAIGRFRPEIVIDCSDAPVVDARMRMLLASVANSHDVTYAGAGFEFRPPARPRLTSVPTFAVIGTGKRTGKTAIAAALARRITSKGKRVVIVAMGRGGPSEPVVTHGELADLDARELVRRADAGEHAATDAYEDAITARVTTVAARRGGAGFSGATLHDTVPRAIEKANEQHPDVVVLEGSGTAIPPAHADATILVASEAVKRENLQEGLAAYRLLISDLVVVTMSSEPVGPTETLSAFSSQLADLARDVPIRKTVLRPTPLGDVAGRKVFFATTAPGDAGPAMYEHLERAHGAIVVAHSHNLADREKLAKDLAAAEGAYEVLVTEVKAAAIDVAARTALAAGAQVVFSDNRPEGLEENFDEICRIGGV